MDGSLEDSDGIKDLGSKKRGRSDSSAPSSSKACRVKQRRDRLNDKFVELGSILEPGRPPKTDKAAILTDVVRMVSQLRSEAQKLKDSNSSILLGASALIAFLVSAVFHEICASKSLQMVQQLRLFSDVLQSQYKKLVLTGTDILLLFMNQDPNLLRSYVVRQKGIALLGLLVRHGYS